MIKIEGFRKYFFVFALPVLMILSMWILSKSTWFSNFPKELSIGITLDLIVTMPFLYFLIIRKKRIPNFSIISIFIIGIITASFILPENNQSFLSIVKLYFLPILELTIFSILVFKGSQIFRKFRSVKNSKIDFYDAFKIVSKQLLPNKIAGFLATEMAVLYYVFFSWKKIILKNNEYTSYKENGVKTLLYAFILIIFIETVAIHSLVEQWSYITAWVLSFLSIYTAFQVLALLKSLSKRPVYIDSINQKIVLRFGFFGFAEIPFSKIIKIENQIKDLPEDKSIVPFSPLGILGGHNIILHLKSKISFEGFYGINKESDKLAIYIDDKQKFISILEKLI